MDKQQSRHNLVVLMILARDAQGKGEVLWKKWKKESKMENWAGHSSWFKAEKTT